MRTWAFMKYYHWYYILQWSNSHKTIKRTIQSHNVSKWYLIQNWQRGSHLVKPYCLPIGMLVNFNITKCTKQTALWEQKPPYLPNQQVSAAMFGSNKGLKASGTVESLRGGEFRLAGREQQSTSLFLLNSHIFLRPSSHWRPGFQPANPWKRNSKFVPATAVTNP